MYPSRRRLSGTRLAEHESLDQKFLWLLNNQIKFSRVYLMYFSYSSMYRLSIKSSDLSLPVV